MANVLVIGSGGREHAICWKLSQSQEVKTIFAAPGSFAIEQVQKTENVKLNIKDFEEIAKFCKDNQVTLVAVGPEDPLANGIADVLNQNGINVFGPNKEAANIESDKNWAKAFMDKHGIPTAKWKSVTTVEEASEHIKNATYKALVVKASGLAAGKGVVVASNVKEAEEAAVDMLKNKKFGSAGEVVVIEELLEGEEVSVLAFCDGKTVKPMLPAQDHKRIFDGDQGPNTGGMGAYCPCPLIDKDTLKLVETDILQKTVNGFQKDGIKYVGVLYAGLMLTKDGPKVLEFNCRFGDPETEVILPLLDSDLYKIMMACCKGNLNEENISFRSNTTAVGVVLASRGYPETSSKGQAITGLEDLSQRENFVVFHCGTALKEKEVVTNGGRVLIVVAMSPVLQIAQNKATQAAESIQFDGKQFRKDIAFKAISKTILKHGKLTYKASGVDITAGNSLVDQIKPLAKGTARTGLCGGLGGFGGVFDVKAAGYKDPLLISGTDGVGTKLKIAHKTNIHSTIGIDLVAMCVNDILAHGAEPLYFLDYFATGKLEVNVAKDVVAGVAEGCRRAGCALVGGETAEMPDFYAPGEYDVAGFAVGAVEKQDLLPRSKDIGVSDVLIGLPSSGVHSNGFSLVNKILKMHDMKYSDKAPFAKGKTIGEALLSPTAIYVKQVLPAMKARKIKAFAHITGGGLVENIPRILEEGSNLSFYLDAEKWNIPEVFPWLSAAGNVGTEELLRTFNCGLGGVVVVSKADVEEVMNLLEKSDPNCNKAFVVGTIKNKTDQQVHVKNFEEVMSVAMRKYLPEVIKRGICLKKKVGVLISGSGTNLQALIDATKDPSQNIGAEIVLVISNKKTAKGLDRAAKANIKTLVINNKDFPTREAFDREMDLKLTEAGVDIICLAGFMRILSSEFTMKWRGRLINIHPALLPSFKGMHAQRQALEAGVTFTGCTVHFVEEGVDEGPIILQDAVPVYRKDTEDDLVERIKTAEHRVYPEALKMLAKGLVKLDENKKLIWQ